MQIRDPYSFYLLRVPTFPIESLFQLNEAVDSLSGEGDSPALKQKFAAPEFLEAIYLASRQLFYTTKEWLEGGLADRQRKDKLMRSLHKYYSRMSSRCTPFGLFAGCATGDVVPMESGFQFASENKLVRSSRFDMNFSCGLARKLVHMQHIRSRVKFRPNTTLYKSGSQFRFIEYATREKGRSYAIAALNETPYLTNVLQCASEGATIVEMMMSLRELGVVDTRCESFINGLIEMQVLVSELEPSVTGSDFFEMLIGKIAAFEGESAKVAASLRNAYSLIRNDKSGLADYVRVDEKIKPWKYADNIDTIQTDLFLKMSANRLKEGVVAEIIRMARRLSAAAVPRSPAGLEEFKKRFDRRYGDMEVPLSLALDPDSGVGYGWATAGNVEAMPLLKDLMPPTDDPASGANPAKIAQLVASKARSFYREGKAMLELTDPELDSLIEAPSGAIGDPTPRYIMGTLIAGSEEEIDKGNYLFHAVAIDAPFPAKLFGRFSYSDAVLEEKLRACITAEQQSYPNAILAEIIHLPEDRLGNIVIRPLFRDFEIPYLCRSTLGEDRQITLDDLYVSLKNDRIVLRSGRLNKEIIPRMANSHNHQTGLPVYKFLNELQYQNIHLGFGWNWGEFAEAPHLPRIQYKKLIINRERWYLKESEFSSLKELKKKQEAIGQFRREHKMPRYVVLQYYDHELLVDMDSEFCVGHLIGELKKRDVTLYEFLSLPDKCFLKDATGSYVTEMVIPVAPAETSRSIAASTTIGPDPREEKGPAMGSSTARFFPPGSEWCFFKIYAGNKILEKVLVDILKPFIEGLSEGRVIRRFFFMRYADPDFHIRLRLLRAPSETGVATDIVSVLNEQLLPLIHGGLVSKWMTDTYVREIERYGDITMEPSEELFCADSKAVLDFIDLIDGSEGEQIRWRMALYSVDRLLDDFGYNLLRKYDLMKHLSRAFFKEFNHNKKESESGLSRSLNDKYRQDYKAICSVLDPGQRENDLSDAFRCFERRSLENAPIVEKIKDSIRNGAGPNIKTIDELMPSYVHMAMNRLFVARPRMHEMVIYHYLHKYYGSALKRQEQMNK